MYNSSSFREMIPLIWEHCVCAHNFHTVSSTEKTTKPKKRKKETSLCLCFSFFLVLSPHSLYLAASRVSLIQSHNKHTHTLSRHIHRLRATKTSCCGSGSAFSEALVSPCLQMCSRNEETYNTCTSYEEIVYGAIEEDFSNGAKDIKMKL